MPFRNGGTYVVTGALGGIGHSIASHLATNHHANLVVVASEALPEPHERAHFLSTHSPAHPTSRRLQRLAVLEAEGESELQNARADAEAGWYMAGFREGLKQRSTAARAAIDAIALEELGARDALAEAFEALKKYEHVAEATRVAARKEAGRRETAALDELGLRRTARR